MNIIESATTPSIMQLSCPIASKRLPPSARASFESGTEVANLGIAMNTGRSGNTKFTSEVDKKRTSRRKHLVSSSKQFAREKYFQLLGLQLHERVEIPARSSGPRDNQRMLSFGEAIVDLFQELFFETGGLYRHRH